MFRYRPACCFTKPDASEISPNNVQTARLKQLFCPKCATQNLEGASFCRVCGANISLVPHALKGQMVQPQPAPPLLAETAGRRRGKPLALETAFKNMFMGVAFLIIAIALSRSIGATWWFWMLIPAFSLMV